MMDCVLSGSLLVVFSLFCYAMCVFRANKLSLSLPFSGSSLVFLLVVDPELHTPYISSPSHHHLFAARAHTNAACCAAKPMLCHLYLVSLSQLLTWESVF